MRLGGCLSGGYKTPEEFIKIVKSVGYTAAPFPVGPDADKGLISAYAEIMRENDILIAEVGAWSNPLSSDKAEREAAMRRNISSLALAEQIGAVCCVNISGSRGRVWDGPHAGNLTAETFDMIVKNTREIIGAVRPVKTKYTLETMPWAYPDSPEAYLRLIEAVDNDAFKVHLDICNIVNSPERYFNIGELIDRCFKLLAANIVSVHLKDIILSDNMTLHLDETLPGRGNMDFGRIFKHVAALPPATPMIIEHLKTNEEYAQSRKHLVSVIKNEGLSDHLM